MSDKKIGVASTTDPNVIAYYNADVVTAKDYGPFGALLPGRKYTQPNSNYRYGFNGKENDNEVKGEGNQQDYGLRIYDPRLGKFLSVDPLREFYPELSPYHFAGNSPIQAKDLDGGEPQIVIGFFLGAISELAEQTIEIGIENLSSGKSFFAGVSKKVDWGDVAISGIQGAASSIGVGGLTMYAVNESIGNVAKSAIDYSADGNGLVTTLNGKTEAEFGRDIITNSFGSVAGGIIPGTATLTKTAEKTSVSTVTSSIAKVSAKTIITGAVKGAAIGSAQGAVQGTFTGLVATPTGLIVDEVRNNIKKSNTRSEKNKSGDSSGKSTNKKSSAKGMSSVNFGKYYPSADKITIKKNGKDVLVNNPFYKKK